MAELHCACFGRTASCCSPSTTPRTPWSRCATRCRARVRAGDGARPLPGGGRARPRRSLVALMERAGFRVIAVDGRAALPAGDSGPRAAAAAERRGDRSPRTPLRPSACWPGNGCRRVQHAQITGHFVVAPRPPSVTGHRLVTTVAKVIDVLGYRRMLRLEWALARTTRGLQPLPGVRLGFADLDAYLTLGHPTGRAEAERRLAGGQGPRDLARGQAGLGVLDSRGDGVRPISPRGGAARPARPVPLRHGCARTCAARA